MSPHNETLIALLRQSRLSSTSGLGNYIGIPMGLALIFTPGLILGAFLTRNTALITALILTIGFAALFALSKYLDGRDNNKFVQNAVASGFSKTEAEAFLEKVDWDIVFPEFEEKKS